MTARTLSHVIGADPSWVPCRCGGRRPGCARVAAGERPGRKASGYPYEYTATAITELQRLELLEPLLWPSGLAPRTRRLFLVVAVLALLMSLPGPLAVVDAATLPMVLGASAVLIASWVHAYLSERESTVRGVRRGGQRRTAVVRADSRARAQHAGRAGA